jgi:hypothetical protein
MDDFRCQLDCGPLAEWIRLDCLLLGNPEAIAELWIDTASEVIQKCVELDYGGGPFGLLEAGPHFPNWRTQWDMPKLRTLFCLTVAAILDFGPRWMLGMTQQCGFKDVQVAEEMKIAVTTYFPDGFDRDYLRNFAWMRSDGASNAVNWVLRTAYFMLAVLHTQLPVDEREGYVPYVFSRGWSKKVLVFGPSDALLHPVIPIALLRSAYARLPRVWLLQGTGDPWGMKLDDPVKDFRLRHFTRHKSMLFGNIPPTDYQTQAQSSHVGYGMWIHGRIVAVDGPAKTRAA